MSAIVMTGSSGGDGVWRRSNTKGDRPCSTTEHNTTRQVTGSSGALPGTPAKIGRRTRISELRPRGPNHATSHRLRHDSEVVVSAGNRATGRSTITIATNATIWGLRIVRPDQISELPNSTNVNRSAISAVVSPYSTKQSQS